MIEKCLFSEMTRAKNASFYKTRSIFSFNFVDYYYFIIWIHVQNANLINSFIGYKPKRTEFINSVKAYFYQQVCSS